MSSWFWIIQNSFNSIFLLHVCTEKFLNVWFVFANGMEKQRKQRVLAQDMVQKQLFLSTTGYGYPSVLAKAAVSRFGQRPCGISIAWLPYRFTISLCSRMRVQKRSAGKHTHIGACTRICVTNEYLSQTDVTSLLDVQSIAYEKYNSKCKYYKFIKY